MATKHRFFWEYPISGDTAAHRRRGTGAATDYETPMNTPIHMPILGRVTRRWYADPGHTIDIENSRFIIRIAHLNGLRIKTGRRLWRSKVAESGNSGKSTGPHVHAYVIDKRTGTRMSFLEWQLARKHKLPANARKFLGLK